MEISKITILDQAQKLDDMEHAIVMYRKLLPRTQIEFSELEAMPEMADTTSVTSHAVLRL